MKGVASGTGGRLAVRGSRAAILSGMLLGICLFGAHRVVGDDDDALNSSPNSNRSQAFQNAPTAGNRGKKPDQWTDTRSEEKKMSDMIAKRMQEQEGDLITEIVIEGTATIPPQAILQKIKTQQGRRATPVQIQQDISTLYKTRWFLSVTTEMRRTEKGLVLVFRVLERPMVNRVEYRGNKGIRTKKLADHTGLKPGSPFDANANKEAAKKLEDFYHEEGYTEAVVKLEKGGNRDDRDVIFVIHEGQKQKVLWRSFTGNNSFSSELLAQQLETTPAYFGLVGGKFDPVKIKEDVAKLRKYYENLGYFDTKVTPEITYSANRKWIYPIYHIEEGPRYKIRRVIINGSSRFSTEELGKMIKVHEGQYYNAYHIAKDMAKIQKKYGELGYYFTAKEGIKSTPRHLMEPGQVDLLVRIDEDIPYKIRHITVHIEGDHPRTKRALAYNYTGLAPGDLADPNKIDKSKRKLTGARTFKIDQSNPGGGVKLDVKRVTAETDARDASVRGQSDDADQFVTAARPLMPPGPSGYRPISPPPPSNPDPVDWAAPNPYAESEAGEPWAESLVIRGQNADDPFATPANPLFDPSPQGDPFGKIRRTPQGEIDLDYYLSEERTGRLMFGVGVNSSAGLVGSIILEEQNFDILRPATSWQDILDGTAWRGAGQRFRVEAIPGTVVSRYAVSWSDPFFLNTPYNVGLSGFYFQRFYLDWTEDRAGGRIQVGRQITQELSVTGALRLEGVRLSDLHVPTPRILQEAGGDSFLSTARGSVIHDTRDMPFMAGEGHRVELGYEQGFGQFTYPRFDLDARQYYTVYARPDGGGRQILMIGGQMGWTGDGTPIYERYFAGGFQSFRGFAFRGVSPSEEGVYVGGQFMAVGTVEYMVPLLVNGMVQLVVFSDFGTVDNGVTFGNFRASVGAGFRLTIPMMGPVPLAFDFGIPVVRQPTDITQVFSFYVGLTR